MFLCHRSLLPRSNCVGCRLRSFEYPFGRHDTDSASLAGAKGEHGSWKNTRQQPQWQRIRGIKHQLSSTLARTNLIVPTSPTASLTRIRPPGRPTQARASNPPDETPHSPASLRHYPQIDIAHLHRRATTPVAAPVTGHKLPRSSQRASPSTLRPFRRSRRVLTTERAACATSTLLFSLLLTSLLGSPQSRNPRSPGLAHKVAVRTRTQITGSRDTRISPQACNIADLSTMPFFPRSRSTRPRCSRQLRRKNALRRHAVCPSQPRRTSVIYP